jgi:hypothetical protein
VKHTQLWENMMMMMMRHELQGELHCFELLSSTRKTKPTEPQELRSSEKRKQF